MRALVDTQILIWLASDVHKISNGAMYLLRNPENTLSFSVISIWETAIKYALNRPDFTMEPGDLRETLLRAGWTEVPMESRHAITAGSLPLLHRDPFDRALVAQAEADGYTLLTVDRQLTAYSGAVLFVG